jgi:hypothetical protein
MRRTIVLLATTAAGFGTGVYLWPVAGTTPQVTAPFTATIAMPAKPAVPASPAAGRVFSADQPLLAAEKPVIVVTAPAPSLAPPPIPATPTVPLFVVPTPATGTETTVRRLSSSRPADEDARAELVRDLQRELKRVGCYEGELNGVWAPAAKKAMAAFTERVNATLPLEEPDYILLTLVQGHIAQACGKACPTGQGLGEAGKCMPQAIIAQRVRRTTDKAVTAAVEPTTPPAPRAPQSRVDKQPTPAPKTGASSWSTVVTEAAPPAPAAATPVAPRTTPPAAPLPGRMAIGAPTPTEPPTVRPVDTDRTKADIARRKAGLAAAEAQQRTAEADADRRARLAEAQVKRAREALVAKQTRERESLAPAAAAAAAPRVAAVEDQTAADNAAIAAAARQAVLRKAQTQISEKRASEANRPIRVTPPQYAVVSRPSTAPRMLPPPYALGAVAAAPRPNYAPEPRRWTRSIFTDISRMR